ncbi:MAG: hypothetical protein OXB88_03050 [Bacteriovoracales bacterium]|nr:hypothetical protein [Bacteriovoracales bacterium]
MKKCLGFFLLLTALTTLASDENYQTCMDEYDRQYVTIPGLEIDLFQEFKIQDSRGPRWGKTEIIEDAIPDTDFWEYASYWSEAGYPTDACPHFTEDDFRDAIQEDHGFEWESVKRLEGSQRTVFYLASFYVNIYTSEKECSFLRGDDRYVFLNELDEDGEPTYLGRLAEGPCRKNRLKPLL